MTRSRSAREVEPFDLTAIRLTLHVLAVTVWVGGQLTLAALVPLLREHGQDITKAAAQKFASVAWPAFAIAVITGGWNLMEVDFADAEGPYVVSLFVKILCVVASGVSVGVHQTTTNRTLKAIGGAGGLVFALLALVLGVTLAH